MYIQKVSCGNRPLSPNISEKGFHYSPGLVERAEAFLFFIAMILYPRYFYLLAYLFTVLVFLTSYLPIRHFLRFVENNQDID